MSSLAAALGATIKRNLSNVYGKLDGGERTLADFSVAEETDAKVSVITDKGSGDWPKEYTEPRDT